MKIAPSVKVSFFENSFLFELQGSTERDLKFKTISVNKPREALEFLCKLFSDANLIAQNARCGEIKVGGTD